MVTARDGVVDENVLREQCAAPKAGEKMGEVVLLSERGYVDEKLGLSEVAWRGALVGANKDDKKKTEDRGNVI
jgi:hypothetical protein